VARITLGHKKSFARLRRDPDLLARLAAEGDPAVIRELLRNPLVTEAEAVRIAARRPARPETLRLLHQDRRWRSRSAVRRALARNPFVETEIALHILPTLPARQVDEMAEDGTLHPLVREAARKLSEARGVRRRR
jgi:ribonuclease D